jgi:DNA polymerase-4
MFAYAAASKAVYRVFDDTKAARRGTFDHEAFLDVRDMRRLEGTPRDIAARLRRDVRERLRLPQMSARERVLSDIMQSTTANGIPHP